MLFYTKHGGWVVERWGGGDISLFGRHGRKQGAATRLRRPSLVSTGRTFRCGLVIPTVQLDIHRKGQARWMLKNPNQVDNVARGHLRGYLWATTKLAGAHVHEVAALLPGLDADEQRHGQVSRALTPGASASVPFGEDLCCEELDEVGLYPVAVVIDGKPLVEELGGATRFARLRGRRGGKEEIHKCLVEGRARGTLPEDTLQDRREDRHEHGAEACEDSGGKTRASATEAYPQCADGLEEELSVRLLPHAPPTDAQALNRRGGVLPQSLQAHEPLPGMLLG